MLQSLSSAMQMYDINKTANYEWYAEQNNVHIL